MAFECGACNKPHEGEPVFTSKQFRGGAAYVRAVKRATEDYKSPLGTQPIPFVHGHEG